ncbi:MAG: alanine--tRNA ligase [Verrucomicrobia bacterium]|nr:alanine--tRNA ligase [Verrucomicrobiota bacterium]MDA1005947.1 alanine--tRNA ligase [Verrucomicrobiota bacterium]
MTAADIRNSFLEFFREKEHTIVPSASLLPQSPGLLFTNAGMNQFVPYFLGTEKAPYAPPRAADTQKCIRAGGKHNDLEDVGIDSYHHTFFEMLGNWSFGDYFKAEAINWAWELIVVRWGFPPERLYATIYRPGEGDPGVFDDEAYDLWKVLFEKAGCDPEVHIVNGNVADNFWMMGDTGPCGPCSELHVDLTPNGDTKGALVNQDSDRCIEIWNLVFIQYNAEADGSFRDLPAKHVDTGMGFERVCSILQTTRNFTDFSGQPSNYATDVFRPLFDKLEELSGRKYTDIFPAPGQTEHSEELKAAIAFRVIADHIRTLSFSIADGILPGNNGRNYVLRRILRRAVRYGRSLGFQGDTPFLAELMDTLQTEMGGVFPELVSRAETIKKTLTREEESFNQTLDRGLQEFETHIKVMEANTSALLEDLANKPDLSDERKEALLRVSRRFSGMNVFLLYDTYGFPLDLTQLLCKERGIELDLEEFERQMQAQRERARAAQKSEIVSALDIATDAVTEFVGFEQDECATTVLEEHSEEDLLWIITDRTCFYAEMGGQVGDTGYLVVNNNDIPVVAVQQIGGARAHGVPANLVGPVEPGDQVTLKLDTARRRPIEAHHTATHLLHWALHEVVSRDATQQGSLVAEDRLRFDFSSAPVSAEQISRMEEMVNERIKAADSVSWQEVPHARVKGREDVMQFFGDKYGELVRVVQIGGKPLEINGYSQELCGGTHVRNTREIGFFRIKREEAIAAGVRRIEAACGEAAWASLQEQATNLSEEIKAAEEKLAAANTALQAAGLDPSLVPDLPHLVAEAVVAKADIHEINSLLAKALAHRDEVKHAAIEAQKTLKKEQAKAAGKIADDLLASLLEKGGNLAVGVDGPAELLQELLTGLKKRQFDGAAFFVVDDGERLHLGAYCGSGSAHKAGALINSLAPLAGGKGGGKPDMARGTAPQRDKKDELLKTAAATLG